jgi:argininosuccinate synthase
VVVKDSKKKVLLAYSGGLDTSTILKWLIDKGYEVITYTADVGQDKDFEKLKEKALKLGASKAYVIDLKKEFITDYIFEALKGNAIYEGQYLLGTSLARPLIAKKQVELAKKECTNILAHGCTGKGNDQVRFEIAFLTLLPGVKIISPWKDAEYLSKFKGRADMLNYAEEKGIPIGNKNKIYSTDENLMHISYESGPLEDLKNHPDFSFLQMSKTPKDAPDKETKIAIEFKKGIPVAVKNMEDGTSLAEPVQLFEYLNKIGGTNGIGVLNMVESRFVGMKSHGVYETPAGTILHFAHKQIESITLDKDVIQLKDTLTPKFSQLIYNGFWFSPEMDMLKAAIDKSQEHVSGTVYLSLYKGNMTLLSMESKNSLYDGELVSMEKEGDYNPQDAAGFIKINALHLKIYEKVKQNENMEK